MVNFKEGTYGFTVVVGGSRLGYITKERGFFIDASTIHGPINLSAKDLFEITQKTALVTGIKLSTRKEVPK